MGKGSILLCALARRAARRRSCPAKLGCCSLFHHPRRVCRGVTGCSRGCARPVSTPGSRLRPGALLCHAQWQSRCRTGHSVGWRISCRGRRGLGGLKHPVMLKTGSFGGSEGLPWVLVAAGWWCRWDCALQRLFGASSSPGPVATPRCRAVLWSLKPDHPLAKQYFLLLLQLIPFGKLVEIYQRRIMAAALPGNFY